MHIFPGRYHAWQNSLPHFVWHCEIILVGCFQATAGEAQEADYESESRSLLWAFPSALGRKQVFQEYCLLLWPASRRTLAVSCLPAIYCLFLLCNTRWSFCLYLWNKSVHFIGEVENLYFYWDLYLLFVARKKKKRKEKKRKKKKTLSLLQRNCNVFWDTVVESRMERWVKENDEEKWETLSHITDIMHLGRGWDVGS